MVNVQWGSFLRTCEARVILYSTMWLAKASIWIMFASIGPKGVFTIETKTISKPSKGESKVKYDGNMVTIMGYHPEREHLQSKY